MVLVPRVWLALDLTPRWAMTRRASPTQVIRQLCCANLVTVVAVVAAPLLLELGVARAMIGIRW